ncbi:MAG: sigma-70 family RNA polymerase sigma factor [Candidatus Omnitrophica bacterium]|nr:sigma-70 family RNA polymerase sigma factor [Candidatus Omnitrophota bacterium]
MNNTHTPSLESIFQEYKGKVFRLALSIARNEKDAEDILQNTFVKIVTHLNRFKGTSKLSTWIYKIAYNEALMYLRKKRRQKRVSDSFKAQVATQDIYINWPKLPDAQLLQQELKNKVDTALKNMPLVYKIPLVLDSTDDLALKDIAKILKLRLNAVKTRLHRGRLMLKNILSDYVKSRFIKETQPQKEKGCRGVIGFLYEYAQHSLPPKKGLAFKKHIKDCKSCNTFLGHYLSAIRLTRVLECRDIPAPLQDKIATFLRLNQKQ